MPQKSAANSNSEPSAKVVVFGVDNVEWLPRAAWFPKSQADVARAAAKQLHLNVVEVINGTAADLVAKIPEGRAHVKGPGAVPIVKDDLYAKVVATINPRVEAGQNPAAPSDPASLKSWDLIKPGHLVLASESLRDGWYEAIVIERTGDKITVRWRDYAGHPQVSLRVTDVAPLHPSRF